MRHQRIADHRRLLEDLLLHEVAVIALADRRTRERGFLDLALRWVAGGVVDRRARRAHHRPIAFLEIDDAARQRRQRQRVAADIHLAIAIADGERRAAARADQKIVVASEQHHQRESAFEPR